MIQIVPQIGAEMIASAALTHRGVETLFEVNGLK